MQRVNSGIFQNIVPSAQKPPKAPSNSRSSQMDTAGRRDFVSGKELEKEEKRRWKLRGDQAVHLVPVVLLVCVCVLYICSSHVTEEEMRALYKIAEAEPHHRRLQAADSTAEEGKVPSDRVQTEVPVTKHDLFHRHSLRLRGGKRHG